MKKSIYLIPLILLLIFVSCNYSENKSAKNEKPETEVSDVCDEFLEHYQEWIDEYIVVIDAYLKNPKNENNAQKYLELMQTATEWNSKWVDLMECADDEKYKKRFEEISKEVEQKLDEIGL